jgi:hypothetical protein
MISLINQGCPIIFQEMEFIFSFPIRIVFSLDRAGHYKCYARVHLPFFFALVSCLFAPNRDCAGLSEFCRWLGQGVMPCTVVALKGIARADWVELLDALHEVARFLRVSPGIRQLIDGTAYPKQFPSETASTLHIVA